MSNCLFCKIAHQEIPTEFIYNDDQVVAFNDINPKAPIHILIVPKIHIGSIHELNPEHQALLFHLIEVAQQIATDQGIDQNGYRLVFNVRQHGGQTVDHIHMHLLGGAKLGGMA